MGTPVPEPPIDYGNDCASCTQPNNLLWAPGETPLYIYAYFAGMKTCPAAAKNSPNGKTFKLTQKEGYPCLWEHWGSEWYVWFHASKDVPAKSWLVLNERVTGIPHFVGKDNPCVEECHLYTNTYKVCLAGRGAYEGIAIIHWMGIVLHLVAAMSLPYGSKIMHELFSIDDDYMVHKFCMPKYGMNIKLKIEY